MIVTYDSSRDTLKNELRFTLRARSIAKLKSHPLLMPIHPTIESFVSIYFDTENYLLKKAGWLHRICLSDDEFRKTLRQQTVTPNEILARVEHEIKLGQDRSDLRELYELCQSKLHDPLYPIFHVEVDRTEWIIRRNGSTLCVTIDKGVIRSGSKCEPMVELKLELRDGKIDVVFEVAKQLIKTLPLCLRGMTIADHGYRLAQGDPVLETKADATKLDRNWTTTQGFQTIASDCIHYFLINAEVLLVTRAPESLHQMRIAIRRLRSIVSFYRRLLSKRELTTLRAGIGGVFKMLGVARELDVLLETLEKGSNKEHSSSAITSLRRKREDAYARIIIFLKSTEFCERMLDLLALLEFGSWTRTRNPIQRILGAEKLHKSAANILHEQWCKLQRFGRVVHLDAEKRHQLRIRAKKLRYACEFFCDLFTKQKQRHRRVKFLNSIKSLQDVLGQLNDLTSMQILLHRQPPVGDQLVAVTTQNNSALEHALLKAAKAAQTRLNRQKPFWE